MGVNNTFNPVDYLGSPAAGPVTNAAVQAAVAAAKAARGSIILSPGVDYYIDTPINLEWPGAGIAGAVSGCHSRLYVTGNTDGIVLSPNRYMPGITPLQGMENAFVTDIRIERATLNVSTGKPVPFVPSAGIGVSSPTIIGRSRIHNVESRGHYVGFRFAGTDFSVVSDCVAEMNVSHGFLLNTYQGPGGVNDVAPLQWYFSGRCLSQSNGGCGMFTTTATVPNHPEGWSQATITGFCTFNNGAYGLAFFGQASAPLHAVRITDSFIGGDMNDEICLDTYAGEHMITDAYLELGFARGIHITANNSRYSVDNVTVATMDFLGLALLGNDGICNNVRAYVNGKKPGYTAKYGFYCQGNQVRLNACSTWQNAYGVVWAGGVNTMMVGCQNLNNTVGGVSGAPTLASANL